MDALRSAQGFFWPAPAKLNLMLHIVGQREDGYHLLQSVFTFLDAGDRLHINATEDGQLVHLNPLPGVPLESDLCIRAAQALKPYAAENAGMTLRIDKQLPMGGGLGGGSSDAATMLVALNQLWGCGLSDDVLADLGLALGADVPVFVRGFSAWAEGVGENLQPIEVSEPWYLVLIPDAHVATVEVFQDPELTRDSKITTMRAFLQGEAVGNDCEAVVRKRYAAVDEAMLWLESKVGKAHLTGTGACVFAVFDTPAEAQQVYKMLPQNWRGFVAQGCRNSPLHDKRDGELQ